MAIGGVVIERVEGIVGETADEIAGEKAEEILGGTEKGIDDRLDALSRLACKLDRRKLVSPI